MIHYHGTPIGGDRLAPARFLRGRHALVPFNRPDDLPVAMAWSQSFVLDNSAYSNWKAGHGRVDVDAYMDWVRGIYRHPGFDWCLIPDVVDGDAQENSRLVRDWLRCGPQFKGVPVWHLHEPLEYLEWLVASFEIVALGSSGQWRTPGTTAWWQRMEQARPVICDAEGRPRCKLHGLRMLNPEIFKRIPFSSADSTNAAVNSGSISRFGMYPPPDRCAARRQHRCNHRIQQQRRGLAVAGCAGQHGTDGISMNLSDSLLKIGADEQIDAFRLPPLAPCPLCGGLAQGWRYREDEYRIKVYISCGNAKAFGPQERQSMSAGCLLYLPPREFYRDRIKEAAEYWNDYAKALQSLRNQNALWNGSNHG